MNTATLSPPPRPPRTGNFNGGLDEPGGGGKQRLPGLPHWLLTFLKLIVMILLVVAVAQLGFILIQSVRLWFFSV